MSLTQTLARLLKWSNPVELDEDIERIDKKVREVRHDLISVQTRTDAIKHLVESMREG